jgi:hypothetical protein
MLVPSSFRPAGGSIPAAASMVGNTSLPITGTPGLTCDRGSWWYHILPFEG